LRDCQNKKFLLAIRFGDHTNTALWFFFGREKGGPLDWLSHDSKAQPGLSLPEWKKNGRDPVTVPWACSKKELFEKFEKRPGRQNGPATTEGLQEGLQWLF